MLEHTNIQTTQIYARITNDKISKDMQGLSEKFTDSERWFDQSGEFDDANSFSEGLAPNQLNRRWRYIDKSGNEVIPLKYQLADSFAKGHLKVQSNGKWSYIDKNVTDL